jgi:hypothetical protein
VSEIKPANHQTDLYPPQVHSAVWSLYRALGEPTRSPIDWEPGTPNHIDEEGTGGFHPVFGLLTHSRSYDGYERGGAVSTITTPPDSGYRGDALSIPCYEENWNPLVLQMSFHKGATFVERLDFPQGAPEIKGALFELLQQLETR